MHKFHRKIKREELNTPCLFTTDHFVDPAKMINFSRMGALVQTQICRVNKKYTSIVYQNERNEIIQMLCAIKHITEINKSYYYGLQFMGIETRMFCRCITIILKCIFYI